MAMSNMASASNAARDALLKLDAAQLLMGHVASTQSGAAQVRFCCPCTYTCRQNVLCLCMAAAVYCILPLS